MRNVLLVAVILIAAYVIYTASRPGFTRDAAVAWTQLPAAARSRIAVYAAGDEIRQIGEGLRRGVTYYRVEAVARGGETVTIKVDAAGKLIGLKYDDDADTDGKGVETQPYPTR